MKGVVFNILEDCVTKAHGERTWDALLDRSGASGAYTSLATYPDEELFAIVGAASAMLGVSADEVVDWFAVSAAPEFRSRFPRFYEGHTGLRSFVASLDDIIHPEVKKLYPNAETPSFAMEPQPDGRFALHYRSRRQMCRFAAGLLKGTAPLFGETVLVEHAACTRDGADHCVLVIDIEPAKR